jgi:hypothetical protein
VISYPREMETVMSNLPSASNDKNQRDAQALWYLLMSMRFIIPAYMLYATYLYWTTPLSSYLQRPF